MSQPKAQKFEHALVRVKDLAKALEFYTEILGLVEIGKQDGVHYLGCGLDGNYDLAIKEGGTGVDHFAVRADSEDELELYAKRLKAGGVDVKWENGSEPGQEKGIRFSLPSGIQMELVTVEGYPYLNPAKPVFRRNVGYAPLNADHINLMVMDVKKEADFLKDMLDFRFSDIVEPIRGSGNWTAAWTRAKDYHHDVAISISGNPKETLHHFAWTMSNFEHMKVAADMMVQAGVRLELGPSRHPVGPNLYAYFWEPGGNRFEFTAEAAIIDSGTPPNYWTSMKDTLDAWSDIEPPKSFLTGS